MNNEKLARIQSAKAAYEKLVEELGEQLIQELLTEFFEAHPEVEAVRWTQYTPYFQDGEPCYFGVNDPEVKLSKKFVDGFTQSEREGILETQEGFYEMYYLDARKTSERVNKLSQDLGELYQVFQDQETVLESCFGDHTMVVVKRGKPPTRKDYEKHG